jgi:hypothetical protein
MIKSSEYVKDILTWCTNNRRGLPALLAPSHFMLVLVSKQCEVRSAGMAWEEGRFLSMFLTNFPGPSV